MRGLRKRGAVWWYRITKAGQTYEGSLQTGERRIALERLEAIRREVTGERFGERHRTFDDAARRFVAEHFETLKPSTRGRYLTSLAALTPHFAGVRLVDIGSAKLDEFERARRSKVTPHTIRRDLACLSVMMTLCEEWEWIDSNKVKPFKRARGKRGLIDNQPRTRYLSAEEEARIIASATPQYRGAIAFTIDTGLRRGELVRGVLAYTGHTARITCRASGTPAAARPVRAHSTPSTQSNGCLTADAITALAAALRECRWPPGSPDR